MDKGEELALRKQLLKLLNQSEAHVTWEAAVEGLPPALRGQRPPGGERSPWELLEHMRIAQSDILEFVRDSKHISPEFPSGYWPKSPAPQREEDWDAAIKAFQKDLASISSMAGNESIGLLNPIPHAGGATLMDKVLLIADHNAYHVGQMVLTRRLLGAWG